MAEAAELGALTGVETGFVGLHAQRVEKAEDLPAAIQTALQNRPALLDVLVTPEAVSSDAKSGLAWVPDLQALEAWDKAEAKWRG